MKYNDILLTQFSVLENITAFHKMFAIYLTCNIFTHFLINKYIFSVLISSMINNFRYKPHKVYWDPQ